MENHKLTVDGDVGEGRFGTPPHACACEDSGRAVHRLSYLAGQNDLCTLELTSCTETSKTYGVFSKKVMSLVKPHDFTTALKKQGMQGL
jgi:hypothetical protein